MVQANTYDVIVIGGGASGMMSAIAAAKSGANVLLVEKNYRLGEKLSITGGGRCNIVNAEQDTKILLANYGKASKFLHSAFSNFGMQDSIDYFESIGLPIKIEAKKRAFPVSERAIDVVSVLENQLRSSNVTILNSSTVDRLALNGGSIGHIEVSSKKYTATNYILATGGASHPETGSTGDGFEWLSELGHDIAEPTPNITPLKSKEKWVSSAMGITLKSVDAIFLLNNKRSFKTRGDILFTHFGVSGPMILNNAHKVAELLPQGIVTMQIDCHPDLNEKQLDEQVLKQLQKHPSKQLKNTLKIISPPGMARALNKLLSKKIDLDKTISLLSKEDRLVVVRLLKALPLTIVDLMGFDKAVVADGGLSLDELDTRTMKSKVVENLYVTGDLLNINRPSGGYSLQLCWTTGYIAGVSAAKRA